MVLIDSRVGSRELLQSILNMGVNAELAPQLDADFQFVGNGASGSVLVGVERKTVPDLVDSMRSNRLAGGQLGRMLDTYDVCYLIVEGPYRRSQDGALEVRYNDWQTVRGNVTYSEMDKFLCSLEELANIRIRRTMNKYESSTVIADLYKWWDKPWNDHQTAKAIYAPVSNCKTSHKPQVFATKATPVERWMSQLPGVDGRAKELAKYFESPMHLATADAHYWSSIKGLRLGKKTIATIIDWIGGA